jgi:FkbM family methyltransferase
MYFDIGANVGNWTAANIGLANKIVAVEAIPETYVALKAGCGDMVIPLNYAVCNNGGEDIVFYKTNINTLSTLNRDWLDSPESRFFGQPYTEIVCPTITLDALIDTYGEPDLIKIDVEGGEFDCVSSLTRKVAHLCFEWAAETNNVSVQCLDHLVGLNFTQFYLQFRDDYTFRPNSNEYVGVETIKLQLAAAVKRVDWGMVWCK